MDAKINNHYLKIRKFKGIEADFRGVKIEVYKSKSDLKRIFSVYNEVSKSEIEEIKGIRVHAIGIYADKNYIYFGNNLKSEGDDNYFMIWDKDEDELLDLANLAVIKNPDVMDVAVMGNYAYLALGNSCLGIVGLSE